MQCDWRQVIYPRVGQAVRQYHVVSNLAANRNASLVAKYGGAFVFPFNRVQEAIAACSPLGGDEILFHPGSYTPTVAMSVDRPLTIRGFTGNRHDVRINVTATDDCEIFTIKAAGDYVRIADMSLSGDDSATPSSAITVAGVGVILENMNIYGADVDQAVAAIDVNAAQCEIRGVRIYDYRDGIDLGAAAESVVEENYIHSDNDAAIAIDVSGVASWSLIRENVLHLCGGTGDTGVKVANGALLVTVGRNKIGASCADPISAGSGGTEMYENVLMGETTSAWIID